MLESTIKIRGWELLLFCGFAIGLILTSGMAIFGRKDPDMIAMRESTKAIKELRVDLQKINQQLEEIRREMKK